MCYVRIQFHSMTQWKIGNTQHTNWDQERNKIKNGISRVFVISNHVINEIVLRHVYRISGRIVFLSRT